MSRPYNDYCVLNDSLISWYPISLCPWWFLGSLHPCFICSFIHSLLTSLVPWFLASLLPWYIDPLIPGFLVSLFPWFVYAICLDFQIIWWLGALNHRFLDSLVPWFLGSLILWFFDSLIPRFLDFCIPGFLDFLIYGFLDALIHWKHLCVILWCRFRCVSFCNIVLKSPLRPPSCWPRCLVTVRCVSVSPSLMCNENPMSLNTLFHSVYYGTNISMVISPLPTNMEQLKLPTWVRGTKTRCTSTRIHIGVRIWTQSWLRAALAQCRPYSK